MAAQDPGDELGKLKKNCPFKHAVGCAEVLLTGQPLHIAVGSIAPQNGFAAGLAVVKYQTTENWRNRWNFDAVASPNASWRGGLYLKLVNSHLGDVGVQKGTRGAKANPAGFPEQPVINVYAQAISLNKIGYFGLGPATSRNARSSFGMREIIVGASGVKPFARRLHLGFYGEANGRLVDLRPSHDGSSPSIEQIYSEASAPGLTEHPSYVQLGAGVRMHPSFRDDLVHLNYDFAYRPYLTPTSGFSFQRFTADLSHQISLYRSSSRMLGPREANGPDDCAIDPLEEHPRCPRATTRNLQGSLEVRMFAALSMTPGGNTVPFYFQPTIGGSDLNGDPVMSSYQDYRFRAPNVLWFRETFEHSLGKWPVGVLLMADQGSLSLSRGDLGSAHWKHSFAAGLTLRAGGFPQVSLLFAWGGGEGTHTTAHVNTALLGGSARPSLF